MKKKATVLALLPMFVLVFVFGCGINNDLLENNGQGGNKESDNEIVEDYEPSYGGELLVPISKVATLNPLLNESKSLHYFNKLIFEGLFDFDSNLNIVPVLVDEYNLINGGQTIAIKLKDNVLWHDGNSLTSDDVKFTIDLLKYSSSNSIYKDMLSSIYKPVSPNNLERILNVQIIDEKNLEVQLDRSYSNALESLIFPILPKHQFVEGNIASKSMYQQIFEQVAYTPIGTGPYKFVSYDRLKNIELTVNENWWGQKPYIEKIIGKVVSDEELAITAFEAGQIDLAMAIGADWEKYGENDKIRIYEFLSQVYEFIGFNFERQMFQGESGKAIRKAIAYGIDRRNIIEKVYLGHATQIDVPIYPNSWLLSQEANTYGYNVSKAREVLESAGFIDGNGDGIYEDSSGKKLTLHLLTNSYNDIRRETGQFIIENLKAIGIEVIPDYDINTTSSLTKEVINSQWENIIGKIGSKEFDMALLGWELSYIPDLSFAFHSSQIAGGKNFILYNNEKMDELLVNAANTSNREKKKESYKELQSYIVEEQPYVSLFFRNTAILLNSKVKGEINPQTFNIYYGIENWYIPEAYQEQEENENDTY